MERMISRNHASIQSSEQEGQTKWTITDSNSVNGVFVNDVKIKEAELKNGDLITFGGGATAAVGAIRKQPESEFVYQFVKVSLKRKREEEQMKAIEEELSLIHI
eukprot:TRINITY_DN4075_c0_g1_i3.p1 TRINITY_DN4075_c0_g1~~TRINITY_DN4075_c0_g1_i3.p1  ORF type:complete len:104 (-),score=37.91 TRINITY_DN4075_c0_g1_i3:26-337(-)